MPRITQNGFHKTDLLSSKKTNPAQFTVGASPGNNRRTGALFLGPAFSLFNEIFGGFPTLDMVNRIYLADFFIAQFVFKYDLVISVRANLILKSGINAGRGTYCKAVALQRHQVIVF